MRIRLILYLRGVNESHLVSSKCLLPVKRYDKSVVWAAFNKNIQKRNLLGLFKFNSEFDAVVTAVEALQKLVSGVFAVKNMEKVSSTYLYQSAR